VDEYLVLIGVSYCLFIGVNWC